MAWFWIGIAAGVLLTVPLAAWVSRRTERRVRRLERRTQAVERLAELGRLTGGLAHEIKNPLSTVGLNIQLLQEDVADLLRQADQSPLVSHAERLQRRLTSLQRENQRLREILEDFLQYAGRIRLDRSPVDVNALVDELVDFFAPQASAAGVHVRRQLDADPSVAPIDAGLIKQALLNLMINACRAMTDARQQQRPHGGADELLLRTRLAGEELLVLVIDTGPGIAPETMGRIFQPYFSTTKGGSGLGLPTARRIVEEHGGTLTCHSEIGRGTEFTLALPLHPTETDQPSDGSTGDPSTIARQSRSV